MSGRYSDGGKFHFVLCDTEDGGDNPLYIVEDRENFSQNAILAVFLGIVVDIGKSLYLEATDTGDIGEHQSGELGNHLCFCIIEDTKVNEGRMDSMSQLVIVDDGGLSIFRGSLNAGEHSGWKYQAFQRHRRK